MNLKVKIELYNEDEGTTLWSQEVNGVSGHAQGMFDAAETDLVTMQRHCSELVAREETKTQDDEDEESYDSSFSDDVKETDE